MQKSCSLPQVTLLSQYPVSSNWLGFHLLGCMNNISHESDIEDLLFYPWKGIIGQVCLCIKTALNYRFWIASALCDEQSLLIFFILFPCLWPQLCSAFIKAHIPACLFYDDNYSWLHHINPSLVWFISRSAGSDSLQDIEERAPIAGHGQPLLSLGCLSVPPLGHLPRSTQHQSVRCPVPAGQRSL